MYDRRLSGENEGVQFGNTSALYESDMVMVDHQTGSYWMQVSGEALVGSLAGERLTPLPSQTTTWALWLDQHPNTLVLSRDTGFERNYSYDPFTGLGERYNSGGEFIFPVSEIGNDPRLDPGEVVLGVEVDELQWAFPIERMGNAVVNEKLGANSDKPIVVFSSSEGPTGSAFSALLNGEAYTFAFHDGHYIDLQTNSIWSLSGEATAGPLEGERLVALPTRSTFWFSMITSFPELTFYTPQ